MVSTGGNHGGPDWPNIYCNGRNIVTGETWSLRCLCEPLMALHCRECARTRLRHRDCGFGTRVHSVPRAVAASRSAARDPTVFARVADRLAVQAALVGLRDHRNLAVAGPRDRWIRAYLSVSVSRAVRVLAAQGGIFGAGIDRAFGSGSAMTLSYDRNEAVSPLTHRSLALTEVSVP